MKFSIFSYPIWLLLVTYTALTLSSQVQKTEQAELGEFPSIVGFIFSEVGHLCTGTLISLVHVAIPGHCCTAGEPLLRKFGKIIAGDIDWKGNTSTHEEHNISKVNLHPDYNCQTYENDIAVITVHKAFSASEYIRIRPIGDKLPEVGTQCSILIWGQKNVTIMHSTAITVINFDSCTQTKGPFIKKKMICAGSPGEEEVCSGGKSGPLLCQGTVHGFITGGAFSCDLKKYGLKYSALYVFRSFLQSAIELKSEEESVPIRGSNAKSCFDHYNLWYLFRIDVAFVLNSLLVMIYVH